MKIEKSKKWTKFLVICFFIVYYAPLFSLIVFSFNEAKSVTFWGGFSLKWYKNLFSNEDILTIVFRTLLIAMIATTISVIIGTLASIALTKSKKTFRNMLLSANNLPITNPDIVTAIGLLLLFVTLGIEKGYITLLLAHISFVHHM